MDDKDFYWLVGILEGEGSFMHSSPGSPPRLCVHMKDKDVMERVSSLLERKLVYVYPPSYQKKGWAPSWRVTVSGRPALCWMQELLPYMGERRQAKMREILERNAEKLA